MGISNDGNVSRGGEVRRNDGASATNSTAEIAKRSEIGNTGLDSVIAQISPSIAKSVTDGSMPFVKMKLNNPVT